MAEKLTKSGIPHKEIHCYGSQIVVTSWSRDAAEKWAMLLTKFAKVRGILEALDEAKVNKNTMLLPSKVKIWRTYARLA